VWIREMVSKIAYVGLVILVVGLLLGVYAAYTPVSSSKTGSVPLLSTSLHIDPNDYQSENVQLNASQVVTVQNVTITNSSTTVYFYIMNQTQYYNFYGCAPFCEAAPANSAASNATGNNATTALASTPLTTFKNVTITSSSPLTNYQFTAPSQGTYYFVFDNSRPNYAEYVGQNASGFTVGQFNLETTGPVTTHTVNSVFLYAGVGLLIIGGAVATATWDMGRRPRSPPPRSTTTTTTTSSPEPAPATPPSTS
jgi:hypothetical protein